jgi:hypothetical protein
MLRRKVLADDADQLHRAEKAGRVGKIRRRAAEDSLARCGGRLNGIDRNGADDEQRHGPSFAKLLRTRQRLAL